MNCVISLIALIRSIAECYYEGSFLLETPRLKGTLRGELAWPSRLLKEEERETTLVGESSLEEGFRLYGDGELEESFPKS